MGGSTNDRKPAGRKKKSNCRSRKRVRHTGSGLGKETEWQNRRARRCKLLTELRRAEVGGGRAAPLCKGKRRGEGSRLAVKRFRRSNTRDGCCKREPSCGWPGKGFNRSPSSVGGKQEGGRGTGTTYETGQRQQRRNPLNRRGEKGTTL